MFYSPKQVAAMLAVDHKTIYRAIDRGELGAHRVGRSLRIRDSVLERWLDEHRVGGDV